MRHPALLALAALACGRGAADKPDDSGSGSRTETTSDNYLCAGSVTTATPSDGAVDRPLDTTPSFALTPNDPSAVLTLSADGVAVPGSSSSTADTVTFVPDQALAYDTTYNVDLTWVCGAETASFTTVPRSLQAFAVDSSTGVWQESAAIAPFLQPALDERLWLLATAVLPGVSIDARIGSGYGAVQDTCVPTWDELGADFSTDPAFALTFDHSVLEASGVLIRLDNLTLTGELAGSILSEVDATAVIHESAFADLMGPDACELFDTFGYACELCPNGTIGCFNVDIRGMEVAPWAGAVTERTEADVLADPSCP